MLTKLSTSNKQKKIIAGGVVIFGVLILFLGFYQIKNKIYKPFDYLYKNDLKKNISQQSANLDELKNKDTDKDGISDYEELNVYFTSPYLKDSDSDGVLDKVEIQVNTDPNCSSDKVCDKTGIPQVPKIEREIKKSPNESSGLSIEEIKQILLKNGIPQEQLNQVDDKTIREVYEKTVKETGINPANLAPNSLSEIPIDNSNEISNLGNNPINLQNMSVEQMREFLLQSGMNEAELKQIDDETLKQLFQKAIKETINQ
jgi:hypothetical protein